MAVRERAQLYRPKSQGVTVPLGTLLTAEPALNKLAAQPMSAKFRYAVARLVAAVRAEVKHFESEREKIIKELGEEADGVCKVLPANMTAFIERVNELAAVEVTIDKWLLTHEALDTIELSPNDVIALGPLIAESDDAESV